MNTASFGYKEGVLLTGNEAKLIIEILNDHLNKENERRKNGK